MPIYTYEIIVPSNTPEDNPITQNIKIEKGVIVRIQVHFPSGCVSLVKTNVFYGIKQIFPHKEGMYFAGDSETVNLEEYFELPDEPTVLTIKAWSPGTDYDHKIIYRFAVLPENIAKVTQFIYLALDKLNKFLSKFVEVWYKAWRLMK